MEGTRAKVKSKGTAEPATTVIVTLCSLNELLTRARELDSAIAVARYRLYWPGEGVKLIVKVTASVPELEPGAI